MVPGIGVEPTSCGFSDRRSDRLSYPGKRTLSGGGWFQYITETRASNIRTQPSIVRDPQMIQGIQEAFVAFFTPHL